LTFSSQRNEVCIRDPKDQALIHHEEIVIYSLEAWHLFCTVHDERDILSA